MGVLRYLLIIALTVWATLYVVGKAEASVTFATSETSGTLWIATSGPDATRAPSVRGVNGSFVPLTTVRSDPNGTLYRVDGCLDGAVEIRSNGTLLVADCPSSANVRLDRVVLIVDQLVAKQSAMQVALEAYGVTFNQSAKSLGDAGRTFAGQESRLQNLSAQLTNMERSVGRLQVPAGLLTESEYESGQEQLAAKIENLPDYKWPMIGLLSLNLGTAGAVGYLYTSRRTAQATQETEKVQAAPAPADPLLEALAYTRQTLIAGTKPAPRPDQESPERTGPEAATTAPDLLTVLAKLDQLTALMAQRLERSEAPADAWSAPPLAPGKADQSNAPYSDQEWREFRDAKAPDEEPMLLVNTPMPNGNGRRPWAPQNPGASSPDEDERLFRLVERDHASEPQHKE